MHDPAAIVAFWLEIGPSGWFSRNDVTDADIRNRFGPSVETAMRGELDGWAGRPEGSLALILLLDQFTRNIHRGDARAFSGDAAALRVATDAIASGHDRVCDPAMKAFYYMPFMHSEAIADQNRCVALMHAHGAPDNLKFAIVHRDIIARFGRFPHRNPALGRHTTPAEAAFLAAGGFSA